MQDSEKARCETTGKVQYRIRAEARWVADHMYDRDRICAYKGKCCWYWHIAHTDARPRTRQLKKVEVL